MSSPRDKAAKLLRLAARDPESPEGHTAAKQAGMILARHCDEENALPTHSHHHLRHAARNHLSTSTRAHESFVLLSFVLWMMFLTMTLVISVFYSTGLGIFGLSALGFVSLRWLWKRGGDLLLALEAQDDVKRALNLPTHEDTDHQE